MKHLRVSLLAGWSGLALLLLVVVLAEAHPQPTRTDETALTLDCSFRAINVTADVGSSPGVLDMQPGAIGSRVVYFASPASTGVITVSTLVSVTDSLCYLWSSPAFSATTQDEFTPTTSVPSVSIPYPVSSGHGPTVTVALTLSAYYTGSTMSPNQVVTLTFVRDITPPVSFITAPPEVWGRVPVKVDWSASDADSGVDAISLFYRQVPTPTWTPATTMQAAGAFTGVFTFAPPTVLVNTPITYELTSQAVDRLGNKEKQHTSPDASVMVWPSRVYLPLVRRDPPVINGDFENDWYGWTHGQGPFLGHGSGLPQSIVLFDGSHRALLGSPALDDKNGSLPVGYAAMSQTVAVPPDATNLTLTYRVHTFDTVYGTGENKYFDTFEFSVGKAPDQITDADRESAGCRTSTLNPQDVTLTPSASGLVFCAGGQPTASPGTPWDSGWRSVQVDLSAFANTRVTLYFANWNREYDAPYFDDKGYYNTYTYVDNVGFASRP
jgi:hypothetical protein